MALYETLSRQGSLTSRTGEIPVCLGGKVNKANAMVGMHSEMHNQAGPFITVSVSLQLKIQKPRLGN